MEGTSPIAPEDPVAALATATHLNPSTVAEILDDPVATPRAHVTPEALLGDPR